MSQFKTPSVTGAELYAAARETCLRLYVLLGGNSRDDWRIEPHPATAAIRLERGPNNRRVWTLSMPAMPMDARLTRTEADTIMSYVVHELGHALFTDFNEWRRAVREGVSQLVNALEDVRIEMKLCALGDALPNARELLTILTQYCTLKAIGQGWKASMPQCFAFTLYQYAATHKRMLGYDVSAMPNFATELSAEQKALFEDVMRRLRKCKSTRACVELALALRNELGAAQQPQQPQQGQGEQGQGEQGQGEQGGADAGKPQGGQEQGEGDTDAGDDAQAAGGLQGQGDIDEQGEGATQGANAAGKGEATTPKDTQGAAQGAGNGAWLSDGNQMPTEPNLDDIGQRVTERAGKDHAQTIRDNVGTTDFLNTPPSAPRGRDQLVNVEGYGDRLAGRLATPAKLRRDLTRAVRSPELMDVEHYHTRGRFDARAMARIETGAENVFRRRSENVGQMAAVSVLVDMSSSMSDTAPCGKAPIGVAVCLAVHCGDALRAAAVPFEIAGFTCSPYYENQGGLLVAKSFRDPWTEARDRVGKLATLTGGGTAMMPAIKAMARRMQARAGVSRRVLLVLTDGEDRYPVASNRAAIAAAEGQGVEVVGMGVLHDASAVFNRYVQVSDLREIADKGMTALLDVLNNTSRTKRAA